MRFFRQESYRKGITSSVFFTLFSKGLGFLNTLIIGYYFGASLKTDVIFYLIGVSMLIGNLLITLDGAIIIPESLKILHSKGEEQRQKFVNTFLWLFLLFGIIVGVVFAYAPIHSWGLLSEFTIQELNESKVLLFLGLPLLFFIPAIHLLVDVLYSCRYFTMPMIVWSLNSLMSILFIVILRNHLGPKVVLIGISIGYLLNSFFLIWILKKRLNWDFSVTMIEAMRFISTIWKKLLWALSGNLATFLGFYAPMYIFSGLNNGTVTHLNYAQKIFELPNAIVMMQVSQVLGINLFELVAKKKMTDFFSLIKRVLPVVLLVSYIFSLLIYLYSDVIVQILFERGEFTEIDSYQTSKLLGLLSFSLVFIGSINMLNKSIMALGLIKEFFVFHLIINILYFFVLFYVVDIFGIVGYPIVYFVKVLLSFGYFFLLLSLYFKKSILLYKELIWFIRRSIVYTLLIYTSWYMLRNVNGLIQVSVNLLVVIASTTLFIKTKFISIKLGNDERNTLH